MVDTIKVTWDTGGLELRPDFFPVPMARTRKIFKLLLADEDWTEDKIRELADTLKEQAQIYFNKGREIAQDAAQTQALADSIKATKPKQHSVEYIKWAQTRDSAKTLRAEAKCCERNGYDCLKTRLLLFEMAGVSAGE